MSDLSEIIESAFCDRVFKGEPDFLASLYRLRDPGSPLDKSGRILASYVRRSSGTDGLSGSVVYRVRCDSSVCYVYELKLQKAHAFRHGMNAAYFFF